MSEETQVLEPSTEVAEAPAKKAKKEKAPKEPRPVISIEERKAKASEASKKSRANKKAAGYTYFQTAVPKVLVEDIKALVKDFIAKNTPSQV